jgi:hypothetical protein
MEVGQLMRIYLDDKLKQLQEMLPYLELVPHGITHLSHEFEKVDKYTMKLALKSIDEIMRTQNLPYVKGFKAPYWLYNQNVVDVLDKEGWWLGVDRNQPKAPRTKKFYEYNYSIDEPFWLSNAPVWKLHAHMLGSDNDLEKNLLNLFRIPLDAEWHFASEFVEDKK